MVLELTVNIASVPFQSLLPDLVPKHQHAQAGSLMGLLHMSGYLISLAVLVLAGLLVGDAILGYRTVLLPLFVILLIGFGLWTVLGVDEQGWAQAARDRIEGTINILRVLPGTLIKFARSAPTLLGCMIADYRKVELRTQMDFVFLWLSRFTVFLGYAAFIQYAKWHIDSNLLWREWHASVNMPVGPGAEESKVVFGLIMGSFIVGGLLGSRLAGPLAEKYGKKAVIAVGMIVTAIADIPFVFTGNVWLASAFGFVIGTGWGAFISADWAFACTVIPKKKAGSYMGIWDISTLLPQVISPLIAGLIYTLVYIYNAAGTVSLAAIWKDELPKDDAAAAALGVKWVMISLIAYFAFALWILRKVREERADKQAVA